MLTVLVLHGPNLHLLGQREKTHYGSMSLEAINDALQAQAKKYPCALQIEQSNSESDLINILTEAKKQNIDGIIFNPAAFTHTSIALRDTLLAIEIPFIEVHLSNIYRRETFRHHSYFSDIAEGVISGLGPESYFLALEALTSKLN